MFTPGQDRAGDIILFFIIILIIVDVFIEQISWLCEEKKGLFLELLLIREDYSYEVNF